MCALAQFPDSQLYPPFRVWSELCRQLRVSVEYVPAHAARQLFRTSHFRGEILESYRLVACTDRGAVGTGCGLWSRTFCGDCPDGGCEGGGTRLLQRHRRVLRKAWL